MVGESEPYLGGEPSLLDPEIEKKGVAEILKALTPDEKSRLPDPGMPIRHFRAEKGHVKKAIEKIKHALHWRKEFDADELIKAMEKEGGNYFAMMERENASGKVYVRGNDMDGRALMYMRPARENTNQMEDNMKHLVWNMEKAIAVTKQKSMELGSKEPLEKFNLMIDYDGFTLSKSPPMSTIKYTLDILQKHYPERMHRAYILNPPMVFKAFWAMVRPFVDAVTKEKIVFCAGKKGMQNLHRTVASVEILEPVAGGTATTKFDSATYLRLPMPVSFDEEGSKTVSTSSSFETTSSTTSSTIISVCSVASGSF